MKKIKKLLTIGLTFLLCFTAFTACNLYKENLWFSEEKLQKCLVSDLPKLNSDKYVRYNDNDVYAKLTEEEFHSYANEIYEYLLESNFVYLGTRGETLHGAFPVYYFEPASELSEFKDGGDYRFVYSDGKIKNGNGELTFCIIMIDYFYPNDFYYPNQANGSTRTIKYDKNKEFEYNAIISLRFNSEAPLGGRYELHEHTCKLVGNEAGHQTVYTCGCPSPDIVELHRDNNSDYKCDVCDWFMAETLPEDAYLLIQAYEEKYPNAGKATILRYCGTYESGAIVAMLAGSDEGFDDAMWTETVADYDFNYSNGNRIRVLYDNEFYTLTEAYENGYLTKENIADILKNTDEWKSLPDYPYLYD